MAFSMKLPLILFFACSLFIQETMGDVVCESLPQSFCSFAISSSGKRCVLENYNNNVNGDLEYTCTTSEVVVETLSGNYIESERCVSACGVDRSTVGISSDALLAPPFIASLCSPDCYKNCPNIVDLYFNLAAGEGVFLPALCEKQKSNPHRAMMELMNSSGEVSADVAESYAPAPAPSPSPSDEY